jgi:peroxiredoxin
MAHLKAGDKAPDFKLFSSDKNPVQLSDYKGKNVVILFFPLAFTSVCTAELCSVRDDISFYNGLNAEILAISVDSPIVLDKFKKEQGLNMTLLSDFNKEASTSYGAIYESFVMDMRGVSKRSAFVVDREGFIRYAEVLENAGDIPDLTAIKNILSSLS